MSQPVSKEAIHQIFTEARSYHAWLDKPVSDDTLRELYELAKWGPTAVNANPMRITFVRTAEGKEKLYPTLMGSNIEQVKAAPVTAIVAFDSTFYTHLKELFPAYDATELFASNPEMAASAAFRNGSLQGAYLLLAARALGLDTCAMSGFDNAKVDAAFFEGTTWKSNFIMTLGYGDAAKLFPRGPRLDFERAVKMA